MIGNRQTFPLCDFIQLLESKLDLIPEPFKKQAFLQFDLSEYNQKLGVFSPNFHIVFQRPETCNKHVVDQTIDFFKSRELAITSNKDAI